MSRRLHRWVGAAACVLSCALGLPAAGADEVPTDAQWSELLLERTLAPIERAVHASGFSLVAIRVSDEKGSSRDTEPLSEAIGNFLWDRGYEVQILGRGDEMDGEGLLLELTVDVADFDQPGRAGSFLGLGATHVLRRAALGFHGRLENPETGRWYWKGAPYVQMEDWIAEDELVDLAEDRPAWAGAAPSPSTELASPWWERAVVGGLLAGVITLYFGGSN